jgi:RND family efflux transporter MFP subunit
VDSDENVFVSPETPGVITNIRVKEGDKVSKGTVMASSDASALLSGLEEVKTSLTLATTAYEKQKRLWDQKIGSEIQFLQAKANKESLESRMASIQAQIDMTRIKSPISGTVDQVSVRLGEMGSPGMNGIRVVNLDKMKIVANVADTYLERLKKGSPVVIELPDINKTIESKISFVSQVINPQNRSLNIEVNVSNKEKDLKPNMIAKVRIQDEVVDTAVVVPSNIIQRSGEGEEYILVAEKTTDGKLFARKRVIEAGSQYSGKTVILKGLQPGDVIITAGYQEIVDGQPVYIK